MLPCAEAIG
jgi:hypothetical protein